MLKQYLRLEVIRARNIKTKGYIRGIKGRFTSTLCGLAIVWSYCNLQVVLVPENSISTITIRYN